MSEGETSEVSGRERLAAVVAEALGSSQSLVPSAPVTAPVEGEPSKGPKLGFIQHGMSDEEMSALDTCGKYGGLDVKGQPCQHPSSFGILNASYGITAGKCYQHSDEFIDAVAERKATFLEKYMNQPANLVDICVSMDMSVSQPYLWKLTDIGFRRTFEALVVIVDAIRHHIAEDAMFDRIRNVEAGADTLRMFYHQNRSHGRWRDVRKDGAPAPAGNTIINAGGDVHIDNSKKVWQIGEDFVAF